MESRDAKLVLTDLASFCRAHDTTFHTDERTHAMLEGRREVFLRIQQQAQQQMIEAAPAMAGMVKNMGDR